MIPSYQDAPIRAQPSTAQPSTDGATLQVFKRTSLREVQLAPEQQGPLHERKEDHEQEEVEREVEPPQEEARARREHSQHLDKHEREEGQGQAEARCEEAAWHRAAPTEHVRRHDEAAAAVQERVEGEGGEHGPDHPAGTDGLGRHAEIDGHRRPVGHWTMHDELLHAPSWRARLIHLFVARFTTIGSPRVLRTGRPKLSLRGENHTRAKGTVPARLPAGTPWRPVTSSPTWRRSG